VDMEVDAGGLRHRSRVYVRGPTAPGGRPQFAASRLDGPAGGPVSARSVTSDSQLPGVRIQVDILAMTVGITGASGHLGSLTTEALLEPVEPGVVVLVTRDPSKRSDTGARGTQVRPGDFGDASAFDEAFCRNRPSAPDQHRRHPRAGTRSSRGHRRGPARGGASRPVHVHHQPRARVPVGGGGGPPRDRGGPARQRYRVDIPAQLDLRRIPGSRRVAGDRERQTRAQQRRRQRLLRLARGLRCGRGGGFAP
jgi:hypothetical protein